MRYHSSRFVPAAGRLLVLAVLLAVLAASSVTWGQEKAAQDRVADASALDQKLLAEAKKGSEIMANLTYLSDEIGPRVTGSRALKKANEWTAEKMKSYGLTEVRLEAWSIPEGWERGPVTARIIEPDNGRSLSLAAMGWTPSTKGKIQGDVVLLNTRTTKELEPYKGKLKGAIVLQGPPTKLRPLEEMNKPGGDRPSSSVAPDGRPEPTREELFAFRRELANFLHAEGAAVLLSDAGKHFGLLMTGGGWRGTDRPSASNRLPTLSVAHNHYELLHRLATRGGSAKTRIEIEVENKFIAGPLAVYNTVGEIKGSEKPDEFVVLGAHLDSWDLGQGTTDNGTGTAVILETARLLVKSGVKPKRTIRFVLFSGEEQGLHGSKAYVEKHKDEMARTSVCLVHDTGTGKVVGLGSGARPALKPLLEAELVSLKELGVTDFTTRSLGGSDHASFESAGVPGFLMRQETADYRFSHHSQADTLERAREADLVQSAQVMAVAALRLANLDKLLPRDKDPVADRDGFIPLFRDEGAPKGWRVTEWNDLTKAAPDGVVWTVKDGILQTGKQRGTWLVSEQEYADFILEFEFKLTEVGNSGVALRSPMKGDPAFDGMELQLADLRYNTKAKDSELTGGIYRAIAPTKQVYKPTEWNKCRIELKGTQLKVTLNGEVIQDVDLSKYDQPVKRHDGSDASPIKDRPKKGHIGFQHLSRNNEPVQIRGVRLKELK